MWCLLTVIDMKTIKYIVSCLLFGFGNIPYIFHGINLQEMYYFDVPALDMKQ